MNYTFVHLPGTMLDVNGICFFAHVFYIYQILFIKKGDNFSVH